MVFGRITVFAAAEDVATVITYYDCFYHLVMPPKRAIAQRLCGAMVVMAVPRRSWRSTAVMAVPRRSHCRLAQPAMAMRKF